MTDKCKLQPGADAQSIAALLQAANEHGIDSVQAYQLAEEYAVRDGFDSVHIAHAAEAAQTLFRRNNDNR